MNTDSSNIDTSNNEEDDNEVLFSETWKEASKFYTIRDCNINLNDSFMTLGDINQNEYKKVKKVLIEIIDIKYTDVGAYIQFTDYTDIMSGTLHPKLVKDYASVIEIGCVICFQNVSILYPQSSGTKYLIFTPHNIEKIFPKV